LSFLNQPMSSRRMRTAEGLLEVELGSREPKSMPWDDDANFSYRQVMARVLPQFPQATSSGLFSRATIEEYSRSHGEDAVTFARLGEYVFGKLAELGAMKGGAEHGSPAGSPPAPART